LKLKHALRVKSAEFWLKLGLPDEALLELRRLPSDSLGHNWASRVYRKAARSATDGPPERKRA
jgi:hypothetical protein